AHESRVRVLFTDDGSGKAGALNLGAEAATGSILVFADARQRFADDAVRRLVEEFAAQDVGAVSGRLIIGDGDSAAVRGVGLYWSFETRFRLAQSRTGSVIGATGAIYAVRRELFSRVPANLILDDVFIPMKVVLAGHRVLLRPEAVAFDSASAAAGSEYLRKLRTMTGNLELLRVLPAVLSPLSNRYAIRYMSHKVFRVLSPVMVILLVATGLMLAFVPYGLIATLVLGVLTLGLVGLLFPSRLLAVPAAFLLVQRAALMALLKPRRDAAQLWITPAPQPVFLAGALPVSDKAVDPESASR
ncbi:MAG: glycosyltransferase, partial [Gemmatimonadetes bacterium]|nr:glycosyltransferase [Gemmatimonadota bacterium]